MVVHKHIDFLLARKSREFNNITTARAGVAFNLILRVKILDVWMNKRRHVVDLRWGCRVLDEGMQ